MKQKNFYSLLLLFSQIIIFGQTLDQQWAPSSVGGGIFSVSSSQNVGQSFTAGVTGDLSRITLRLINGTSAPSTTFVPGDFQVRIFAGNGYSGTLLNTTVINLTSVPTSYIEQDINLSSLVPVNVGSQYTIDFRGITGTVGIHGANAGYNSGGFYFSNGNTGLSSSYDLWFKTFVNLPTPGTHLNFDGVDDYVNCGNTLNSVLDPLNTVTVEAWVKPATNTGLGVIVGNYASPTGGIMQFLLRRDNADYTFWVNGTSGVFKVVSASNAVVLNTWQHIAGVWNGSDLKIYINGVLAATTTGVTESSFATTTNNLMIGNNQAASPEKFTGSIDEVRIWTNVRTAEQISGSKNCELSGTETGLIAYYKFNQGIDASNNAGVTTLTAATGPNGTLNSFTLNGAASNWLAGSPVTTGSIIPSVASVTSPVVYSQGATASALTATTGTNGTGLMWYTTATSGTGSATAPTPSTATSGTTNYWVASTNANGCESARVQITVNIVPTNDDCTAAITLNVGTTSFNDFPLNVNLTGATNSGSPSPTCGNFQGADLWYTVTVPASGNVIIETNGVGNYDTGFEVYSGNCGALSLVTCDDNTGTNNYSYVLLLGQTPGTVLKVRVWENFWANSNAQFQISAYDYVNPATHLNLDGVNDHILIPATAINNLPQGSIEAWIRPTASVLDNQTICAKQSDFENSYAIFSIGGDTAANGKLFYKSKNGASIVSTSSIVANQWTHVAVTFTGSQAQIYLNGVLDATASGDFSLPNDTSVTATSIGAWLGNGNGQYFKGDIDEFRVWNAVLTPADITNTMNCELQIAQTNIVTYYKFNQGFDYTNNSTVTALTDSVGSNNGTLTNFALAGGSSNWKSGSVITSGNVCSVLNNEEFDTVNAFKVYPNPNNGFFTINSNENFDIVIYDIVGKIIYTGKSEIGENTINMLNFNNGIYVMNLINEVGKMYNVKIVKN